LPASLAQDALAEASTSETGAKPKAGFGWSHSFLHLKQWHPLSFKNQEKLFLAEQAEADRRRRDEEAAKEFAANAEFFKNTELLSAKDRTALRNKQQLAFMYQKPPGFDAMLEKQAAEAKATEDAARAEEEAAARAAERGTGPSPARAGGYRPAQVAEAAQGRVRAKRPHKRGGTRARGRARRAGSLRDDTSESPREDHPRDTVQAVRRVRPRQRR